LRLAHLASSTITGALLGTVIPIGALVMLTPSNYGAFSTIYLFFAYGVSLQYSIVSEAWTRGNRRERIEAVWPGYSATLGTLAMMVALAAFVTCQLISEVRSVAWWLSIAVLLGIYRSGTRYYWLANGATRRVVLSDILGIAGLGVGFVVLQSEGPIVQVAAAWSLSTIASAAAMGFPLLQRGAGPLAWWRARSCEIKPLLADSLLMDIGAIGTPFLLAGSMGAEGFGIYRGIANASMPVRLLVDPLRPALGRKNRDYFVRGVPAIGIISATGIVGLGSYFALSWLVPNLPLELGTLSSLEAYASPAAIFASANLVGTIFYIVCRTNADRREIMVGRLFQTLVVVCMPLFGFFMQGISGAIWGFALSALMSALVWVALTAGLLRGRTLKPGPV
jgi:hypothetical protein